jgi:acetyl-CoA carboxylase biotin carboxylase subunit
MSFSCTSSGPRQGQNPVSFRPSPGRIVHYHPPGALGVRVDSAVYHGYTIPPFYE